MERNLFASLFLLLHYLFIHPGGNGGQSLHTEPVCQLEPNCCQEPCLGPPSSYLWSLFGCLWSVSPQKMLGTMRDKIRGTRWARHVLQRPWGNWSCLSQVWVFPLIQIYSGKVAERQKEIHNVQVEEKRTSGNVMFELGDEKIKETLFKSRVKRKVHSGKNLQSIKSPIYKRERAEEYFVAKNK